MEFYSVLIGDQIICTFYVLILRIWAVIKKIPAAGRFFNIGTERVNKPKKIDFFKIHYLIQLAFKIKSTYGQDIIEKILDQNHYVTVVIYHFKYYYIKKLFNPFRSEKNRVFYFTFM
jgi:hypothetical protein